MHRLVRIGVLAAALAIPLAACQATAAPTRPGTAAPETTTPAPDTANPAATAAPTAAPTTAPTATPTPGPSGATEGHLFPSDVGKTLVAGTYTTGKPFVRPFSFTVPDGFSLGTDREGNVAISGPTGYLGVFPVEAVFADPCAVGDGAKRAWTADQVVEAFQHMTGFAAGDVTETTIDGRPARSFELSNSIETADAGCARGAMLPLFTSVGNPEGEATNGGTTELVWVLDVEKASSLSSSWFGPFVIVADGWGTDADRAILERIATSVDFE